MRVAVVEIGTRAVRYLVADVTEDLITPIRTRSRSISLGRYLEAGANELAGVIRQLKDAIREFRDEAEQTGAERFLCFGTAALRKLRDRYPRVASEIAPDLRVLSPSEEAECSFVAGVTDGDVEARSGLQYVVIDMGGGSVEVIAGRIKQSIPTITDHVSFALGSDRLSKQLRNTQHDMAAFDVWLDGELNRVPMPTPGVGAKTILMGSVPTKVGWLQVRPSPSDIYNPKLVGGATIERDAAEKIEVDLLQTWRRDPQSARRFVDPRSKDDSEIDLVVGGLHLLGKILTRQQRRNCVVSARGTRFGLAFKFANDQL